MYSLLTVTDGALDEGARSSFVVPRAVAWDDEGVSWDAVDCVIVTLECAKHHEAMARVIAARERDATLAIVLAARPDDPGLEDIMREHDLDGFVDVSWPPSLARACIEAAVRHARIERNVVEIQRVILEQTRTEAAALYEEAARDELTRLYTRRHIREIMEREQSRCRRDGRPYATIFVDVDDLKRINDAHGHAAGSRVLRSFGQTLESLLRASDTAGRVGGDEFIVFLANCDHVGAAIFADRLRRTVEATRIAVGPKEISFSISMGVASFPEHGVRHSEVIDHADRALYRAKAHGKNCTVVFGSWPDTGTHRGVSVEEQGP